ncbi:MAG TPA: sulfite exporter TauE/SafE family protein [Xanthobacteraceae bacterium]|nr:sulfite exporter TauE/SafE family protein [Xanthobacteraceae bacterium]
MSDTTRKLELGIEGMHCANCSVLIERKFAQVAGVQKVRVDHASGKAEVLLSGPLDIDRLQQAIKDDGYRVLPWQDFARGRANKNTGRDYAEIGAAFLVVIGAIILVRQFGLLPNVAISDNIGFGIAFLFGLVASVSTCMAVTGGLLVAVAAKYNEAYAELTAVQRLKPHIYFNVGRILSYAVLGAAIGALGSALMLSPQTTSALTIAASLLMIVLGLQMLRLLPSFGKFFPALTKNLGHRVHEFGARIARGGAFLLGALTFFLPCGFTQALQLYALSKGSAMVGALTMLAFALGTLPALLSLSALSSFAAGTLQRHFLKFAGATVIVLGIFNIQYGFVLMQTGAGASAPAAPEARRTAPAPAVVAKQIVNMRVEGLDYVPNRFVVKQGILVEWRIDASRAAGCGRILIAPGLGIRTFLSASGTTVLTFTPDQVGEFAFNCGMGMMTPGSKFTVVPNA